jgi:hypothetical protein
MNRENILAVADAIEKHSIPDLGFNMAALIDQTSENYPDVSGHNCGTVACIAGWATFIAKGMIPGEQQWSASVLAPGRLFLDITQEQASRLFSPAGEYDDEAKYAIYAGITPSQAVSVLRHLAETGEVDWNRALSPTEGERG